MNVDDWRARAERERKRADAVTAAGRTLIEKWRDEAERHKKHGDCYRVGEGWGLGECADELEAVLKQQDAI